MNVGPIKSVLKFFIMEIQLKTLSSYATIYTVYHPFFPLKRLMGTKNNKNDKRPSNLTKKHTFAISRKNENIYIYFTSRQIFIQ